MIQFEARGEVAIIRLDRAAKKNAQTPAMLASLCATIRTSLSARAIVLSGVGDVFCAGFDLSSARDDESVLPALLRGLASAVRELRGAPCPVVGSAHGAAIAGGCALLCGCDFVVTDRGAKLGYPAVKLGISPAVSAHHLACCVGAGSARTRLLDPGVVGGEEAVRIGLASHLVETPGECEAKAAEVATALAAKPRHALGYTRRWLNELEGSLAEDRLGRALAASLSGVGADEQRTMLGKAWNR